jgi:uncharacterized SAM-dependent methyltransferase
MAVHGTPHGQRRQLSLQLKDFMTQIVYSPATQLNPAHNEMLRDVLLGLSASQKSLSCKYFYDDEGSRLFDEITELEEYYPTRTEVAIMESSIG